MNDAITFVGMDTSKTTIHVAALIPGREGVWEHQLPNEPTAVRRLFRKLDRESPGEVRYCYEAGPCGYVLQRQIEKLGARCDVVAPSLIPVKPGDRIKTNRRDARKLAEALRGEMLTPVHPPTPEEEAVRGLCRARGALVTDRHRARQRIMKFLLQRGMGWTRGRAWTIAYRGWVRKLAWEHTADRMVFSDLLLGLDHAEERLKQMESKLEETAQEEPYRERVGWLRCFRGIDTLTAMTILTELHDPSRFPTPRALMAYLGLVLSEYSTGDKEHRGGITHAGNGRARSSLVEASWHYRHKPSVQGKLLRRRQGQPAWVLAIADRAQLRLHKRYWSLVLRGKLPVKAVTAVARELTGFIWAVLQGPEVWGEDVAIQN